MPADALDQRFKIIYLLPYVSMCPWEQAMILLGDHRAWSQNTGDGPVIDVFIH